ncbi:hypothetical protein C481_20921 [Natrialba asiatica DSM 12278]|uniref:Uncharacterized protein n=1 Tax=Natrialba asiatica (strain ATCC 700177 / DSM 12278 / JCM 9576 / FERM P-10747 / NBRC 102637 / 172P1) TaxID=29540 RepID=M0AI92_NATA1|nr:hypothetical protein C481_20921 [Natrialba asiatica DSM 12278]
MKMKMQTYSSLVTNAGQPLLGQELMMGKSIPSVLEAVADAGVHPFPRSKRKISTKLSMTVDQSRL